MPLVFLFFVFTCIKQFDFSWLYILTKFKESAQVSELPSSLTIFYISRLKVMQTYKKCFWLVFNHTYCNSSFIVILRGSIVYSLFALSSSLILQTFNCAYSIRRRSHGVQTWGNVQSYRSSSSCCQQKLHQNDTRPVLLGALYIAGFLYAFLW